MHAPELLRAHLHEMLVDFSAWRALYADDATLDFVYGASAGVTSPLHGIDAIAESISGFLNAVRDFKVQITSLYGIDGEDAVMAEFSGTGTVISTGRTYNQNYIVYLRAEAGKIVMLREYWDPTRVIAAFQP
jgi:hypothetical protein